MICMTHKDHVDSYDSLIRMSIFNSNKKIKNRYCLKNYVLNNVLNR